MAAIDWHLDKRVSIIVISSVLINILVTGYGMVWYASKIDSRVAALEMRPAMEERMIRVEALIGEQGRIISRLDSTLAKLDETLDFVAKEQARRTPFIKQMEQSRR